MPRAALSKVPEVTAMFWVAKATTTALGEAASDFLVHTIAPVLAVVLGFVAFLVALAVQFAAAAYRPAVYWTAVAMVGVFGTMAADVLHVGFGVPYLASAPVFALSLAAIFVCWHRTEGTVSVHTITTRRRETFYWLAVVATFALGTAAGDLTAVTFRLGYLESAVLFAAVLGGIASAYWYLELGAVLSFWSAYVLTRPLGASLADWFGVSKARGGLDVGSGVVASILAIALVGLVAAMYLLPQRTANTTSAAAPASRQ